MKTCCLSLALCATFVGTLAAEDVSPRSVFTSTSAERDGEACCEELCDCDCSPSWTFRGGAIFLQRSNPAANVLSYNSNLVPLIRSSDFQFNPQAGFDVSAIRSLDQGRALEMRYFQVDGWNETVARNPINSIVYVPQSGYSSQLNSLPNPHILSANYRSALRSAEFNLLGQSRGWLTPLVGFRYLNLDEKLTIRQEATTFSLTDNHLFVTRNNLYGGQLGLNAALWTRGRLRVDSWLKAGIYANDSSSQNQLSFSNSNPVLSFGKSQSQAAFVGDLGFVGVYQINHHLALRGGYQLLWVDGVALATDQFSVESVNANFAMKSNGSVFYHGALVGLELTW